MATALEHLGGVEALVLGGCCELNSTAHALITEIGTQLGHLMATGSGDGPSECVALEIHRTKESDNDSKDPSPSRYHGYMRH